MATPHGSAVKRMQRELTMLAAEPLEYIHLRCDEENIFMWSYLCEGPPGTPYEGGWYWGELKLPDNYPFAPPAIFMRTPNGRFEVDTRLCLSMSDFHPESWQPAWSLSSLMKGLLSFMCEDTLTTGAVMPLPPPEERKRLARRSLEWNLANADFMKAFPDIDDIVAETKNGLGRTAPVSDACVPDADQDTSAVPIEAAELPVVAPQSAPTPPATVPPERTTTATPVTIAPEGTPDAGDKTCDKCNASYTGFGATCSACRKLGKRGSQLECAACGCFFTGFGAQCNDCVTGASHAEAPVVGEPPPASRAAGRGEHDPRPFVPGDAVRLRPLADLSPEERALVGHEAEVKKSGRAGMVRIFARRKGEGGVNLYVLPEKVEHV